MLPDRPPLECTEDDIFGWSDAENRELDRQADEAARYAATLPDSVRGCADVRRSVGEAGEKEEMTSGL